MNENAYIPQLVSIGPVHHGNTNLAKMERQELRYLNKFCGRTSTKKLEGLQSFDKENVNRVAGVMMNLCFRPSSRLLNL